MRLFIFIFFLLGCDNPQDEFVNKRKGLERCISILGNYEGIGVLIPHELKIDSTNQKSIEEAKKELIRFYRGLTIPDFQELMKLMAGLKITMINDNGDNTNFYITNTKGYVYSKDSELTSDEEVAYQKLDTSWFYWENKR